MPHGFDKDGGFDTAPSETKYRWCTAGMDKQKGRMLRRHAGIHNRTHECRVDHIAHLRVLNCTLQIRWGNRKSPRQWLKVKNCILCMCHVKKCIYTESREKLLSYVRVFACVSRVPYSSTRTGLVSNGVVYSTGSGGVMDCFARQGRMYDSKTLIYTVSLPLYVTVGDLPTETVNSSSC